MAAWRFLLDENIDPKVRMYLQKEGVFAVHVRDTLGQGADGEAERFQRDRQYTSLFVGLPQRSHLPKQLYRKR
jgi:hypothetical protein